MAALSNSLDSLPARTVALLDSQAGATPAQLARVRDEVVEVGRQLASIGEWTTAEDAQRELATLPSWLSEAFGLERHLSSSAKVEEDVKPVVLPDEESLLPDTPAEEEEETNPFAGLFAHPRLKRESTPSPQPPLKPEDPASSPRRNVSFPDLFNLPLSVYPALSVPSTLLDAETGTPIFDGGFMRQMPPCQLKQRLASLGFPTWNEVGGGNSPTYVHSVRTLFLKGDWNMLPSGPGMPVAGIMDETYPEEIQDGEAVSIFGGYDARWYYYGEYVRVGGFRPSGAQLGALDQAQTDSFVRFFARHLGEITNPAAELSSLRLERGLARFQSIIAGDRDPPPFAVWRCVAFDETKARRLVRKRDLRLKLEDGQEVSEEEVERGKADVLWEKEAEAAVKQEMEEEQRANKRQRRK